MQNNMKADWNAHLTQVTPPRPANSPEFEAIATMVQALAEKSAGDGLALLGLLRLLEELHREIRDGLFQTTLPRNRQALYGLLRDIESEGGWPYIPRMKLRSLLIHLAAEFIEEDGSAEVLPHAYSPDLESPSEDK